jgi:tetratricopeptide (TPR) repeat protein
MKFWYCETCGRRITEDDLASGAGQDKQLKGMYCKGCAVGVMTVEMPAITSADVPPPKTRASQSSLQPRVPPRATASTIAAVRPKSSAERTDNSSRHALPAHGHQHTHAPQKPNDPSVLVWGGAGGVVVLLVIIVALASSSGGKPIEPQSAAPVTKIERAAPAPVPATSPVAAEPSPLPKPRPLEPVKMVVDSSEERAATAFTALQLKLGGAGDDNGVTIAAIESFLDEHGGTIVAARARKMLQDLKKPPKASTKAASRESGETILDRGTEKERKGDYDGALVEYEKAIEVDPKLAVAHSNAGNIWRMRGEIEKALAYSEEAIALDPKLWNPYAIRAICLYGLGRETEYKKALETARKLHNDPSLAERAINQSAIEARAAHTGKALEGRELTSAKELVTRARYRQVVKQYDGAIADYEAAVKSEPGLAQQGLYKSLAAVAEQKKDWQQKLQYYKLWMDAAPSSGEALNSYAWELLTSKAEKLQDAKAALPVAEKAAEASKHENAGILDTLALAMLRTGNAAGALEVQQKAINLLPPETTEEHRKEYTDRLKEIQAALKK